MSDELVVGIDLGTTNTCVGIFRNNLVTILENKEGTRVTPSFVYFMEQKSPVVGYYAKRMAESKPEFGIYEIKRFIGRKFEEIEKNLEFLPFHVRNVNNEPLIVIEQKSAILKKKPVDLCACILKKIKDDVETKFGHSVNKAVITVPAYFNVSQRENTLAAANQVGFTVLKLLNEPTAAALSYYYNKGSTYDEEAHSLVYDLGGGTFDVAILRKRGSNIEIVGVDGDSHLGGHDFDNILVKYICQELKSMYNFDPANDRRNMRRLKKECEEAKKILSNIEEATVVLNAFVPNHSTVEITIARNVFETLSMPYFTETINIVDRCLKKANLTKSDIKEVIMSGGSTRIPKVGELLSKYFNGKSLCKFVHPDECVGEGAALQAAMLSKAPEQAISQIKITDVTALSLGISNFVDVVTFLIKRNSPIPAVGTTNRITVYDKQSNMSFDIYEGERLDAKKNYFLGTLQIENLTPAPPGQCSVMVKMSVDENGLLSISATESVSNKTKDLKIVYARGIRSDNETKNVLIDARENEEEDKRFRRFAEIKANTMKYCIRAIYNFEQKELVASYRQVYDKCVQTSQLVKNLGVDDERELTRLNAEVRCACDGIQKRHQFQLMP